MSAADIQLLRVLTGAADLLKPLQPDTGVGDRRTGLGAPAGHGAGGHPAAAAHGSPAEGSTPTQLSSAARQWSAALQLLPAAMTAPGDGGPVARVQIEAPLLGAAPAPPGTASPSALPRGAAAPAAPDAAHAVALLQAAVDEALAHFDARLALGAAAGRLPAEPAAAPAASLPGAARPEAAAAPGHPGAAPGPAAPAAERGALLLRAQAWPGQAMTLAIGLERAAPWPAPSTGPAAHAGAGPGAAAFPADPAGALRQLAAVPPAAGAPAWPDPDPRRAGDALDAQHHDEPATPTVCVARLELDLPRLGPLRVRLRVAGHTVAAELEHAEPQRLAPALERFAAQLQARGLAPVGLRALPRRGPAGGEGGAGPRGGAASDPPGAAA